MWLVVAFDLPTETKDHRRAYAQFRKRLLNNGYIMLQYSVYARPCPSLENVNVHMKRVERNLPDEGQVRVFTFTDAQFARTQIYYGKLTAKPEKAPEQLSFW